MAVRKLLVLSLLLTGVAAAQITEVAGGGVLSTNGTTAVLSGKNLTAPSAANVILVSVVSTGTGGTITDSQGNTYTSVDSFGSNPAVQMFCVGAPAVAASMSFTYTCSGGQSCFPGMTMVALAGTAANSGSCGIDQNIPSPGGVGNITTAFTPSQANEAWFSVMGSCWTGNTSTTASGIMVFDFGCNPGVAYGTSGAYGILSGSPATSVQWTNGASVNANAAIISIAQGPTGSIGVSPTAIPANHSGNITLTLTGNNTAWSSGSTVLTVAGVTGVTKVSQNITSATAATLVVTTGSGVGTLTVSDGTNLGTATTGVETLSVSPNTGTAGGSASITLTGTNTVWTQETAASLFSVGGGLGSALAATPSIINNTHATATLNIGSTLGVTSITDTATGVSTSFTGSGSACSGYAYSAALTVAQVSAALTNFPVMVSLTIPPQNVLNPQGDDICVSDSGNTANMPIQWLSSFSIDGPNHEWNWQSGQANFIFNAASLSATAPTQFRIWAGKAFAVKTNPDSTSAWDSNTSIALHMQEPMFPYINAATGGATSSGVAPARTGGAIGFAEQFASANHQVVALSGAVATGGPAISGLFNTSYAGSSAETLLDARGALSCGTGAAPLMFVQNGLLQCTANGTTIASPATVDDGNWHHGACSCSGSGCALYLDGSSVASTATAFSGSVGGLTVGGACSSSNYLDGKMEEARFAASSARPAAWLAAEAANLLHPSTFVTLGSWSFAGGTGPTISATSLTTNSTSSLLATWTTSTAATSRVLCGTSSGGPYGFFTPMLHPVQSGSAFWGQTSHSTPITGLHSATTYFCVFQSIDSNGNWSQSSELSAATSAAFTSTPLAVTWAASPTRPNDAGISPSGANGMPFTGCWFDGDTQFSTWAADGNQYGMTQDGGGPLGAHGTGGGIMWYKWQDLNHLCATWIASANNFCAGPACSGTPYTDGFRLASQGSISVNGTIYQGIDRYSGTTYCCSSIIKSGDFWVHSLAPQDNTGPSSTPLAGVDIPTQGNVMWQRVIQPSFIQVGKDHNSGVLFPHVANNDGWVYMQSLEFWTNNWPIDTPALMRVRVEDLPLQDASRYQYYTGAQAADDGIFDAQWSYDYTRETRLNHNIQNFLSSWAVWGMVFLPDFNRFVWVTNPQAPGELTAGTVLWDAKYPWSVPAPIANIPRSPTYLNHFPGFGQLLSATYSKVSASPLTANITLSTASGYPQNGTPAFDDYSTLTYFVGLSAQGTAPARPVVASNSRSAHIGFGLDLFYNFQGFGGDATLKNLSPSDPGGQYNSTVGGSWNCGGTQQAVGNGLFYDQYGMYNFGYPGTVPWGGFCSYALTTPYAPASTAFTALVVWAHYPATAPYYTGTITLATPSGETVLSKGTDLVVKRHGSSLNSGWDVSVGGTTINSAALPCNDGSFCALVIRRDSSNNVTVYRSNAIQAALPLTPDATGTVSTAWSSSPLVFGDPANSLIGVLSEALVWNRALSDAELIHEMSVARGDMAARGVVLQ